MYSDLTNENEFVGFYNIKEGDTLYKIAREYNVNPKLLAELNGINMDDYIYPNQTIMIPRKDVKYYITKDDDTLKEVSRIFGTTEDEIVFQNKSIYLLPGQMIFYKDNQNI